MIFDDQLQKIKAAFLQLPKQLAKVEHFIVIMLSIMNFPFETTPLYLVGLKDMFREIVKDGKDTIKYEEVFSYVVG